MMNELDYRFVSGYTGRGLVNYLPLMADALDKVIVLEGYPGLGKSTILRRLGLALKERGFYVQFWLSPLDPAYLEGIYIPQRRTVVVDGELKKELGTGHLVKSVAINLKSYRRKRSELPGSQDIEKWEEQRSQLLSRLMAILKEAGECRNRFPVYEKSFGRDTLLALARLMAANIRKNRQEEAHYYAQALTSQGLVDYTEDVTRECRFRYIIEGTSVMDCTVLLQEIAEIFKRNGCSVSYYHSFVDPGEIDMVILESLRTAVINGTTVRTSRRPGDQHLNLSEYSGINEPVAQRLEHIEAERQYQNLVLAALEILKEMKNAEERLGSAVARDVDFDGLDALCDLLVLDIAGL